MKVVVEILSGCWETLTAMSPYLLMGFFVAGLLSVLIRRETVERQLGGNGFWPILKASLFGVPLPLCSCSVIPVAASLRRHGASRGATAAFLISTPQTGVDNILTTYGLLGGVFAIFLPITTFVSGLLGGLVVQAFGRPPVPDGAVQQCTDECCADDKPRVAAWRRILHHGFVVLPRDLARPMTVGLLVAGLMGALVPDNFFSETIGTGLPAMLLMMLVGVPIYVCAIASIPVAAMMMVKGVTAGTALVFLMTGPATNAATIAVVWKMLGRRAVALYLAAIAATALGSGLILDRFFTIVPVVRGHAGHGMLSPAVSAISAAALLALLAYSVWSGRKAERAGVETEPATGTDDKGDRSSDHSSCCACGKKEVE